MNLPNAVLVPGQPLIDMIVSGVRNAAKLPFLLQIRLNYSHAITSYAAIYKISSCILSVLYSVLSKLSTFIRPSSSRIS